MPDRTDRTQTLLDRPRLDAVVDPIVRAHGGEVVDIEWKQEPGGWVLRVFVEKLGSAEKGATTEDAAVSLDLCSNVARDLSPALDVADLIPHRYHLEVGSPGVERALKSAADYARFVGKKVKIKVHTAVDGQKVLVGVLEPSSAPGEVTLRDGSRVRTVPLDQVASGHLVFEFGPAPKPGKSHKAGTSPKQGKSPKHRGDTSNS
jgi:ribosome maturation factor RimP